MDSPWFKVYRGRYKKELQELKKSGFEVTIDEETKEKGILRLHLSKTIGDEKLEFIAVYPIEFPYFRPQVYSEAIELKRHQNPIDGNLCLLGRSSRFWNPEWSLKDLLENQLDETLAQGNITNPESLKKYPEEQAEPASVYFNYYPFSHILVDVDKKINLENHFGTATIGIPEHSNLAVRGALLELSDYEGNLIHKSNSYLDKQFPSKIECFWAHLDQPPYEKKPVNIHKLVQSQFKAYRKNSDYKNIDRKVEKGAINRIIAISFPEEIGPGENGIGWLFYIKVNVNEKHRKSIKPYQEYLARALRIDDDNYFKRIESLHPLRNKKISLVGVGSLGSPCAIELAKSGVKELCLVDHDFFDPATSGRWALGMEYAGYPKAYGLTNYISKNYPYTSVKGLNYGFGKPLNNLDVNDQIPKIEELYDELRQSDLIIDTTAEQGVNHFLSRYAEDNNLHYLMGYSTNGYWGGVILSIKKNSDACWFCFQLNMDDGEYQTPPENKDDPIQPQGCDEPTFMGPHFEAQNFLSILLKKAVGMLSENHPDAYPELNNEVYILSNRDTNGHIILPKWESYKLMRNKKCPYCN